MSQTYKQQLVALRKRLQEVQAIGKAASDTVELDQTRQGRLSRMDALQQQAMAKAALSRRNKKLQDIAAALNRIEKNTFGYCKECDENINPERLNHNPTAIHCIQCAENLEG